MFKKEIKNKLLSDWFARFEQLFVGIDEEPGYFRYNPLSAIAVAEWCARLQELDKKNRELNGGESRYADFDLETTGLHSPDEFARGDGGITDIGASLIINNQYLGNSIAEDGTQDYSPNQYEFDNLTNPGILIPEAVTELTGITNEMVSQAKPQKVILEEFREFTKGAILVGHNIGDSQFNKRGFDVARVYGPIANALFGDEIDDLLENSVDTLPLFKNMIAGVSHKNEDLCARLGITLIGAHRAIPDVRVNALAFSKMLPILLDAPVKELLEYANSKVEQGYHVLTHVQPGAVVNEDNKLESWIEFGVKLDKKHLQLPGRKQVLIVKFDKEKDEFIYEDTEFRSGIVTGDELSEKIQDHILRQQACVLKRVKTFDEVVAMQDNIVF